MTKRMALFIDYANLWSSNKTIKTVIDFEKLVAYLAKRFSGEVGIRQIYFAYPEEGTRWPGYNFDGIHRFGTYLEKSLKFGIRKKTLKRILLRDESGNVLIDQFGKEYSIEKGNLDVELTIDAVMMVSKYDEMILFSGDSDFLPLVNFIRNSWKTVRVFSTQWNISTELRFWGNSYTDIANIPEIVKNELRHKWKT